MGWFVKNKSMKRQKKLKLLLCSLVVIIILINIVAFFHAYKFTHFSNTEMPKTKSPSKLSAFDKIGALLFGINNPRPINTKIPTQKYQTIKLKSNKLIECWNIKSDSNKGYVILFHGYSGEKSSMIDKSDEFLKLGYNTILVDFMGCGGSEGNQTTIGFNEAQEVKTVYDFVLKNGEKKIYLFGTSLGAAAILKAIHDYELVPQGIIIECPFGSMYQTTCARFRAMNIPSFPMAGLLDFWGGIQNGFWAFNHNPTEYAKTAKCPTLLFYGKQDKNVSQEEIDDIYKNIAGKKKLVTFPNAGHENYLTKYKEKWTEEIALFLSENK